MPEDQVTRASEYENDAIESAISDISLEVKP